MLSVHAGEQLYVEPIGVQAAARASCQLTQSAIIRRSGSSRRGASIASTPTEPITGWVKRNGRPRRRDRGAPPPPRRVGRSRDRPPVFACRTGRTTRPAPARRGSARDRHCDRPSQSQRRRSPAPARSSHAEGRRFAEQRVVCTARVSCYRRRIRRVRFPTKESQTTPLSISRKVTADVFNQPVAGTRPLLPTTARSASTAVPSLERSASSVPAAALDPRTLTPHRSSTPCRVCRSARPAIRYRDRGTGAPATPRSWLR